MKRALPTLAAALILVNTLLVPAMVHADGVPEGTNCNGNQLCKPQSADEITKKRISATLAWHFADVWDLHEAWTRGPVCRPCVHKRDG